MQDHLRRGRQLAEVRRRQVEVTVSSPSSVLDQGVGSGRTARCGRRSTSACPTGAHRRMALADARQAERQHVGRRARGTAPMASVDQLLHHRGAGNLARCRAVANVLLRAHDVSRGSSQPGEVRRCRRALGFGLRALSTSTGSCVVTWPACRSRSLGYHQAPRPPSSAELFQQRRSTPCSLDRHPRRPPVSSASYRDRSGRGMCTTGMVGSLADAPRPGRWHSLHPAAGVDAAARSVTIRPADSLVVAARCSSRTYVDVGSARTMRIGRAQSYVGPERQRRKQLVLRKRSSAQTPPA